MSGFELQYQGADVRVYEFENSERKITNIRPDEQTAGWFYLYREPKATWATYHLQDVQSIEISEQVNLIGDGYLHLQVYNSSGRRSSIFLHGVTLDMIADAIGCEQMVIQATEQEGLLA